MRIIKPSVEILTPLDGKTVLQHIEMCGRTCYKSEGLITPDSCYTFVRGIIERGHESVLEHVSVTARLICDRGVSHEIVRHRLASYSQESTRYCNYAKDKFDGEITVIEPCYLVNDTTGYNI
ncbi:MAG: FAD-dependent thymidylate synthase, partial [Clostridia bacterium]|nr:FAD-dependent thymidylate synthase [Clostridia bacterium]